MDRCMRVSWGFFCRVFVVSMLFLAGGQLAYGQAADEKISDVRILIDISGSMKQNDPNNLRAPALRLITGLLPDGSHSGVWTFGEYVNMLVQSGEVDSIWRSQAEMATAEISSLGMYTNIESALEKSTWDWAKPDEGMNRSLILLTDGLVDVSKDSAENEQSRARVLENTLLRLQDAGVTIHTIALSSGADQAFLGQLSAATGGWSEVTESADKLERVFLKMFEKSVPVETLPLTDNVVLVDGSIKELTLLVFRKEGASAVELIQPDGKQYDYQKTPDNVRWRHEARYDLVTVTTPVPGRWKIEADIDPDNRVMVVTDLKLKTSQIPNVMLEGDDIAYQASLYQEGALIDKPEFLGLVRMGMTRLADGQAVEDIAVADDGGNADSNAGDGYYGAVVSAARVGEYEYQLLVDGTTFKRTNSQVVKVVGAPVQVSSRLVNPGNPAFYSISMVAYPDIVDPESINIDATLSKQSGGNVVISVPRVGANEWRLDLDIHEGDIFNVDLELQGARKGTTSTEPYTLGRYTLGENSIVPPDAPLPEPALIPTPAPIEEKKAVSQAHEAEVDAPAEEALPAMEEDVIPEEEGPSWWMVIAKVLGFNLVIIGAGYFGYRKWFADKKKGDEPESDKEADEGEEAEK